MTDEKQKKIFSQNFQRVLSESGKQQCDLAKLMRQSNQVINSWYRGISLPSIVKVQRLAEILNVRVTDLIDEPKHDSTNYDDLYEHSSISEEASRQLNSMVKDLDPKAIKHLIMYAKMLVEEQCGNTDV